MTKCLLGLVSLLLPLFPGLPPSAEAQRLVCEIEDGRVGFDQDAHLGHALLYRDSEGSYGRATVRYLVRIAPDCFTRYGMSEVSGMSLWIHDGTVPEGRQVAGGKDCPAFVPKKRPITLLYGLVHRRRAIDVRDLRTRAAKVGKRGRWQDYDLGETLKVGPELDVVVGVEIEQEAGECPFALAPPTGVNFGNEGSYLQIVRQELPTPEGGHEWQRPDCDGNGVPDVEQGFAAHVRESLCGETVGVPSFQWRIRALGD